jgi:signal transduction histidine kinase
MTEYEMSSLWLQHWTFLLSMFLAFISGTSAFLIVINLKGRDLSVQLYRLVLALYLIATLFFMLFMGKVTESILNLRRQMIEKGMDWYNVVYENQTILPILMALGLILIVSLVVGAVCYSRSVRK